MFNLKGVLNELNQDSKDLGFKIDVLDKIDRDLEDLWDNNEKNEFTKRRETDNK